MSSPFFPPPTVPLLRKVRFPGLGFLGFPLGNGVLRMMNPRPLPVSSARTFPLLFQRWTLRMARESHHPSPRIGSAVAVLWGRPRKGRKGRRREESNPSTPMTMAVFRVPRQRVPLGRKGRSLGGTGPMASMVVSPVLTLASALAVAFVLPPLPWSLREVFPLHRGSVPPHHIGYVCRQEQLYEKSTIVESEGRFFRLDLSKANLPPLRAFTPILFSTNLVPGVNCSRTPTFIGYFTRVYIDGQGGTLHPHPVQGSFEDGQPGKLNFLWNPQHVFRNPIRHSVPCSFFPGMVKDVDVCVTFSIRPPRGGAGPAFPFVKAVSLSDSQRGLLDEAVSGIFPPEFLKDLKESPVFEVHIGVGLPENDVFPTVSYSDFNVLSSNRNVNWHSLSTYVHDKYEKRSKAGDAVATGFIASLGKHRANLGGQKSILMSQGFGKGWGG